MRKLILGVAVSLDGFIEGPNGEYDWCLTDQDYGLSDFFKRLDALFIGRKTYEMMLAMGDDPSPGFPRLKEYVFSNSLNKVEGERILINGDLAKEVNKIKKEPGKNIWLFGGAVLTTSFIHLDLVDEMALAVHPVLLGAGKTLFQNIPDRVPLQLINTQTYPSGLVMLSYKFQSQ